MPTSIATPATTNVSIPQSRNTMSSGVPMNADIEILSSTNSSEVGANPGTSWKPAESRSRNGRTWATVPTRCQAIAVRSADTPAIALGRNMCRV
jgi:hypothetical protein